MTIKESELKAAVATDKPYKLQDGGGLYVSVKRLADGSTGKYWRYDYSYAGKRKTLSIGLYPEINMTAARKAHQAAKALLNAGKCPSTEKQRQKKESAQEASNQVPFKQVALDWYNQQKWNWCDKYIKTVLSRLERDVFPVIGAMGINEVKPADVIKIIRTIGEAGSIPKAHEVLNNLNAIYRYAGSLELADRNPADIDASIHLKPHVKQPRATIIEPSKIGEVLRSIDAYHGYFSTVCALKLAPMLMLRPSELRACEWQEIDLEAATLTIQAKRMKMRKHRKDANLESDWHVVPLPSQAVAILKELHQHTGHSVHVFPNVRSPKRCMSQDAINKALGACGIASNDLTAHGFRGMASTLLNRMRGKDNQRLWDADLIEQQLAHKDGSVRGRYNRADSPEAINQRREMLQAWADYLDSLKAGAQVIPFKAKAG
ncbi:MAG: DUF4102 domain-containing protein [Thiothrix sp.]|nr:MAG: DUF4102 domain-containing protein [Thiothrix sp.]